MITSDELLGFLTQKLPYEQKIVSYVDQSGLHHYINKFTEIPPLDKITLKVEGMEKYSQEIWEFCIETANSRAFKGPVTAHAFLAKPKSPSFGWHTDPDDVLIYCVEGNKTLYVENTYYNLRPGECVFIKADTRHKITNEYSSLILSIGFEKFLKDKL